MARLEAGELASQDLAFASDGAAGERERSGRLLANTGQLDQEHPEQETERGRQAGA
jgi:hypothetical protein